MKYLIFLFMFLLASCVQTKKAIVNTGMQNDVCYKIIKIKSKKPCYTIYAKRNDSIFKILSEESNFDNKYIYEKIKVRQCYKLNLVKICPVDTIFGMAVMNKLHIGGMGNANGEIIFLEKKSHNTLYQASNLAGLYIHYE